MRWQTRFWIGLAGVVLAACTLTLDHSTPGPVLTATPISTQSPSPTAIPPPTFSQTAFASLETVTEPYDNAVSLLDGVCFEFLHTMDGETWSWAKPADLTAFYNRVDASEFCVGQIERGTFGFNDRILVGVVNVATGCDAAHRVIDLAQDAGSQTQTLTLELEILPGCEYELVQPFLIAIPRPPDGFTVSVVLITS